MTSFRKIHLIGLMVLFGLVGLSTEVKADVVSLTLTPTTYQGSQFTLSGLFTNSGNLAFRANRFDLISPPGITQLAIGGGIENGEVVYTRPVPAMSSTPVLGLLDLSFSAPQGTYTFSVTFSGFDSSGVAITTAPQQFTVDVPVPEPATIALLSTGLLTAAAAAKRRRRNAAKK